MCDLICRTLFDKKISKSVKAHMNLCKILFSHILQTMYMYKLIYANKMHPPYV